MTRHNNAEDLNLQQYHCLTLSFHVQH